MDEAIKTEIEALRGDFNKIKEDLAGLSRAIGQLTGRQAAEGVEELREVRARVETLARMAAGDARDTLEQQVKEKPLGTLLIAFTLGMLIGKTLGR